MFFGKNLYSTKIIRKQQKYIISKKISSGTYGDVFKMVDKNNQIYAGKKLPRFNKQTLCEKIITAQLFHPNIIRYYETYERSNFIYLITELAECDLHQRYWKLNNLTLQNIKQILIDIAKAIEYLHNKHIVHGDIKMENILICGNTYKLCDFSLSFYCQNLVYCPYSYKDLPCPELLYNIWGKPTDIWYFGKLIDKLLLFYIYPRRYYQTTFGEQYARFVKLRDLCYEIDYKERIDIKTILDYLSEKN